MEGGGGDGGVSGSGSPSQVQPVSPMEVLLSPRYRRLQLGKEATEDDKAAWVQQRVSAAVSEGCVTRGIVGGVGGYVLGLLFGGFFFGMKPIEQDISHLPWREQIRQSYKGFIPEVVSSAKGFAKIGAIYSIVDCFVERERATKDTMQSVYSGCVTGAALAWNGGPGAMVGGCVFFATFSAVMDKFMGVHD
uniref:Mitochondrial import inner membrane translocase subunit TIM22 n=1 Tax=Chromera velia CCMP2878 TaxID=1169474 RepID=A0A0G4GZ21_9ALVE|eukprot:Cvel_23912.t1-p1 / transcript=Cvel_23912.t1 / gene=Cvel_23912 / organism=Chromera_velia_CCMP2878 / gene_product=Mitochondrial import inner membrane translocase, putative / transcript_product=Mitochondrial import inner membrane translocase, putative / location=Cvel_scaffold2522:21503-24829(-) / protein_length=190 / sequence_SO=supercontig / SO=protein_coding / is_pseudo=false